VPQPTALPRAPIDVQCNPIHKEVTEQVGATVTRIREVPGSNTLWDTGYPADAFRSLLQSLHTNTRIIP
jgi:hypothetical protein